MVPRNDEHQGEYVPARAERLAWLTGFTGSAGFCIALRTAAGVFVDGRYRTQVKAQVDLAEATGLDTDDGIVVDEHARASKPHTWAAGDVAEFPYLALGQLMRVEGSDHAERHGRLAGENMAGADRVYDHLPRKWFRLDGLQFEGVGELNSRLDSDEVWIEPGREGVIFYLREDVVRGVMLCNVPDRLDWARGLIREARPMSAAERAAMLPVKA